MENRQARWEQIWCCCGNASRHICRPDCQARMLSIQKPETLRGLTQNNVRPNPVDARCSNIECGERSPWPFEQPATACQWECQWWRSQPAIRPKWMRALTLLHGSWNPQTTRRILRTIMSCRSQFVDKFKRERLDISCFFGRPPLHLASIAQPHRIKLPWKGKGRWNQVLA